MTASPELSMIGFRNGMVDPARAAASLALFALWLRADRARGDRRGRLPKRAVYATLCYSGAMGAPPQSALQWATVALVALAVHLLNAEPAYDPADCEALRRFAPVKRGTHCIFALRSRLWGSRDFDVSRPLEWNVRASAGRFEEFARTTAERGLDGFLFEVRGAEHGKSPESLGRAVGRVLRALAEADPRGADCMGNEARVGRAGWSFRFARESFFVTAFAPCYPSSSARFAFGAPADSVFVLLQPDSSFLRKNLTPDTPDTDWANPHKTERNLIRCRFREAGREYVVPPSVSYAMAPYIVPALEGGPGGGTWWSSSSSSSSSTRP